MIELEKRMVERTYVTIEGESFRLGTFESFLRDIKGN
jgi:hypothetical protein